MGTKTVILTFDDAVSNHSTLVAPLLKKYNFNATFFVCEFPPDFASNKKQYMSWEQIKELDAMGFEVANHTLSHPDITKLTDLEFENELSLLEERLAKYGIRKPESFAYPGCAYNEKAFPVLLKKGYRQARICGGRSFIPSKDKPLEIPSFPVDGAERKVFYDAVSTAGDDSIPVLLFHGVPEYTHPWVNTSPELFEEYMRYLADNEFRVIAMRDWGK